MVMAYLFGHYDSRGGSFLVEADDLLDGLDRYVEETYGYDMEIPAKSALLEEDFMFRCKVHFVGTPTPESGELDSSYGGEWEYGVLQHKWPTMKKWMGDGEGERRTLVFWTGKKPVQKELASLLPSGAIGRLVRKDYGEDACGLILIRKSPLVEVMGE